MCPAEIVGNRAVSRIMQERFHVDVRMGYYFHGSLVVEFNGECLVVIILPILIFRSFCRDKMKGWIVAWFTVFALNAFSSPRGIHVGYQHSS